jgi:hypothetical protein
LIIVYRLYEQFFRFEIFYFIEFCSFCRLCGALPRFRVILLKSCTRSCSCLLFFIIVIVVTPIFAALWAVGDVEVAVAALRVAIRLDPFSQVAVGNTYNLHAVLCEVLFLFAHLMHRNCDAVCLKCHLPSVPGSKSLNNQAGCSSIAHAA